MLISTATEMAKEEASSFWGRRLDVQRCCGGLFEGFRTGVQLTDILIFRERLRIQIPFKLGNEQGTRGIAEDVDGGADHIEHTVDASDQGPMLPAGC